MISSWLVDLSTLRPVASSNSLILSAMPLGVCLGFRPTPIHPRVSVPFTFGCRTSLPPGALPPSPETASGVELLCLRARCLLHPKPLRVSAFSASGHLIARAFGCPLRAAIGLSPRPLPWSVLPARASFLSFDLYPAESKLCLLTHRCLSRSCLLDSLFACHLCWRHALAHPSCNDPSISNSWPPPDPLTPGDTPWLSTCVSRSESILGALLLCTYLSNPSLSPLT
jgi:hypothetical protein